MAELLLRHDLARAWRGQDAFAAADALEGEVVRLARGRRTLRVELDGQAYFAKVHGGVGWREVAKPLVTLKPPVLGARNEYRACRRLAGSGVPAPTVAAYGWRGWNPARRQSFIVCDALESSVSLEAVAAAWRRRLPPASGVGPALGWDGPATPGLRRRLLLGVADLARRMHGAGVGHRDFYLCHILAQAEPLLGGEVRLAVIDLHRARTGRGVAGRWRLRDLAALAYSASAAGVRLSRQDKLRFVARYCGVSPREALSRHGALWRRVERRAERLAARAERRGDDPAAAIEGRAPPFAVAARRGDGRPATIHCLETLRRLPGRRLVVRATLDGREAAVKFFFGKGAGRRCRAEVDGLSALAGSGAGAASPLASGRCAGAHWSAAAWIGDGRPPEAQDVGAIVDLTGRLHRHGLIQRDPHPGNFIVAAGQVAALDGGSVRGGLLARLMPDAWRRHAGRKELARLLAAFAVDGEAVDACHRRYCSALGIAPPAAEAARISQATRRAGRRRRRAHLRKTERRCTEFERRDGLHHVTLFRRAAGSPALARLLAAPDAAVAAGERLKDGNTATVARVRDGAARFVVKRYNAKMGRARRAWRNGHLLGLCGIPTAAPIAWLRPRRGGAAYLVLEDLGDGRLDAHVARHGVDEGVLGGVERLFAGLKRHGLTHGDTKASNFIVGAAGLALVDLDALRPAWLPGDRRRDALRFARNWEGAVAAAFAERLGVPA